MSNDVRKTAKDAANQKRKKNHWVPKVYLKTFAVDKDHSKIWRFSKSEGDPDLKPIEKVAVKFYLYTPNDKNGRDYSFEAQLSSLEQLFDSGLWSSAANGFIDLDTEISRKGISLLTAVMYLRNPIQLEIARRMHRSIVDYISADDQLPDEIEINGIGHRFDPASWPAYRDANDDDIRRMWLDQIGSAGWLAKLLMKMRWSVVLSGSPAFITTDNPVTIIHPSMKFRGFKDPETMVLFPISPTRLLLMDHKHSEPSGQYYPLKDGPGGWNNMLFRNANEFLFSSRHPDEVCAEICNDADLCI